MSAGGGGGSYSAGGNGHASGAAGGLLGGCSGSGQMGSKEDKNSLHGVFEIFPYEFPA